MPLRLIAPLTLLLLGLGPARAEAQERIELGTLQPADQDQAMRDLATQREILARDQLRQARLAFERGAFERAVQLFSSILSTPVALRSADDLHEGFLYWSFTLFLMADKVSASDKLQVALRLKPTFAPSPVTTRPDLLAFYQEQQAGFVAGGGIQRLPQELFPELAQGALLVRTRRDPKLPLFGVRLRQLGQPELGNTLMGLEIGGMALCASGYLVYGLQFNDRTPTGNELVPVYKTLLNVGAVMFWAAMPTELVLSLVLHERDRRRNRGPLRAFEGLPNERALGRQAADLAARRRSPGRLRLGPTGFVLTSW